MIQPLSPTGSSERHDGLDPEGLAVGAVAHVGFHLVFGGDKPALAAVVLDRRADGERPALVVGDGFAMLLVVGDLLVEVATHTGYPTVAKAPTHGVIGNQLLARAVVCIGVLEVEGVHALQVGIQTALVHVADTRHWLHGPVVAANVGDVLLVPVTRGRIDVQRQHGVQLVAQMPAQHRAKGNVANACLVLRQAGRGRDLQIHQRHDGVKPQRCACNSFIRHPHQARCNHVRAHLEAGWRHRVAVVIAHLIGAVDLAKSHAIQAWRR
ncbi:hypothetical protein SDC9_144481 [bioreactor metagenome]|uniref:Uncharacterized protein n=1 Tax=bioreactor metagenome TaxID=1076179 RepID=A0A645E7U8_9ZZZZ